MITFLKLLASISICIALVISIVCVFTRKHRPKERKSGLGIGRSPWPEGFPDE